MFATAHQNQAIVTAAPRRGRLVYVVLLALAWLQLSYAGHQFEHAVDDVTESCAVCSHFDRLEHAVAPDVGAPELPGVTPAFVPRPARSADARFEGHYFSRAPPVT